MKMYTYAIIFLLTYLIAYKFFNISSFELLVKKITPMCGYLGVFSCFSLGAAGTAKGISTIARSMSGGSVKFPKIGSKALLGIIFCEANFMYTFIHCIMLRMTMGKITDTNEYRMQHMILACGIVVGISSYCSSVSTGVICGAITVMDTKDHKLFSKLVPMELISSSIGLLGMVIGFVLNEKIKGLA